MNVEHREKPVNLCVRVEYHKISNKNCNGKILSNDLFLFERVVSLIFYVCGVQNPKIRMRPTREHSATLICASRSQNRNRAAAATTTREKMKWKRYKIYCNWYRLHSNVHSHLSHLDKSVSTLYCSFVLSPSRGCLCLWLRVCIGRSY